MPLSCPAFSLLSIPFFLFLSLLVRSCLFFHFGIKATHKEISVFATFLLSFYFLFVPFLQFHWNLPALEHHAKAGKAVDLRICCSKGSSWETCWETTLEGRSNFGIHSQNFERWKQGCVGATCIPPPGQTPLWPVEWTISRFRWFWKLMRQQKFQVGVSLLLVLSIFFFEIFSIGSLTRLAFWIWTSLHCTWVSCQSGFSVNYPLIRSSAHRTLNSSNSSISTELLVNSPTPKPRVISFSLLFLI